MYETTRPSLGASFIPLGLAKPADDDRTPAADEDESRRSSLADMVSDLRTSIDRGRQDRKDAAARKTRP